MTVVVSFQQRSL